MIAERLPTDRGKTFQMNVSQSDPLLNAVTLVPCKASASLLPNNLSTSGNYLVYAHGTQVHLLKDKHTSLLSGSPTIFKSSVQEDDNISFCRFGRLASGAVLVVLTTSGLVHIYDEEGRAISFTRPVNSQAYQGIATDGESKIYIGCVDGSILVYTLNGNKLSLLQTLSEHKDAICDLTSSSNHDHSILVRKPSSRLCSSDQKGNIVVWDIGSSSGARKLHLFPGEGSACNTLAISSPLGVAGYASGHLRIYDIERGEIQAEITAHTRAINAIDIHPTEGLVVSTSEDTVVNLFTLPTSAHNNHIEPVMSTSINNAMICGVQFCGDNKALIAVVAYDSPHIRILRWKV